MRQYAKDRFGVNVKSFFVKPACVDLVKFNPDLVHEKLKVELGLNNRMICVYAGKLGGIYLKEEVFYFIKACFNKWGNDFRFLLLSNVSEQDLNHYCKIAGIPRNIIIQKFIPHDDVPSYLSLADFAINPVKPVPTKRYCTSIKDGEYWAMGLPVVISPNISDDSTIIQQEKIGLVINLSDRNKLSEGVESLAQLMVTQKDGLRKKIRETAKKYRSYSIAESIYKQIY